MDIVDLSSGRNRRVVVHENPVTGNPPCHHLPKVTTRQHTAGAGVQGELQRTTGTNRRVEIELLWLGVHHGALTYRALRDALGEDESPDAAARQLARTFPASAPPALLHSTSWRYDTGQVVLTYVAACDPTPQRGRVLSPVPPARSGDLLAPCPLAVSVVQVASHACRHLAMLRVTDEHIAAAAGPEFWELITAYDVAPAGELVFQHA
ncbi:hypothetical protein [Longispora urticae]